MKRGTFGFGVTAQGDLADLPGNVEALRRLFLDRSMINDDDLGPGDPGDFDYGAWHVGCHLVAAGGVRRAADGRLLSFELVHDPAKDEYFAGVTADVGGTSRTVRVDSAEGQGLLQGSTILGFIEGNSVGRTTARDVIDPMERFNGWQRPNFDRPAADGEDGGRVWEHWCTLRDIRPTASVGSSVLRGYVTLCAVLGDRFAPTVARGRRDYGHPKQLCALVRAGFTTEQSARWDTTPIVIPPAAETLLLLAQPNWSLAAAKLVSWSDPPRYYMFSRRIAKWSPAAAVVNDLRAFSR